MFPLLREDHLVQQVAGAGELFYREQDIADVKRDVAAVVRVEDDVTHRAFPDAVKVDAYQVAVLVYYRASRFPETFVKAEGRIMLLI